MKKEERKSENYIEVFKEREILKDVSEDETMKETDQDFLPEDTQEAVSSE